MALDLGGHELAVEGCTRSRLPEFFQRCGDIRWKTGRIEGRIDRFEHFRRGGLFVVLESCKLPHSRMMSFAQCEVCHLLRSSTNRGGLACISLLCAAHLRQRTGL